MDTNAIIFNCLRDILYNTQTAKVDMELFPPEFLDVALALKQLSDWMKEYQKFSLEISRGNLDISLPDADNVLAYPIKAIYGTLSHLTWQTQQIAKGDFSQRVDLLGDFSTAFNSMTEQLAENQHNCEKEREIILQKNKELESVHGMFITLTMNAAEWIVVLDKETNEILFLNKIAEQFRMDDKEVTEQIKKELELKHSLIKDEPIKWECSFNTGEYEHLPETLYCLVTSQLIPWRGNMAVAHVITNNTSKKMSEIEKRLYKVQLEQAENSIFMGQIQTHFFYYTMNSIRSLIKLDPDKAYKMTADLSKYIQYNIEFSHMDKVPFSVGLKYLKAYCNIKKQQFKNRLSIIYQIETQDFTIPPFTIQQIIEETIQKRLEIKPDGGRIIIKSYETDRFFVVELMDNGVPLDDRDDLSGEKRLMLNKSIGRVKETPGNDVIISANENMETCITIKIKKEAAALDENNIG